MFFEPQKLEGKEGAQRKRKDQRSFFIWRPSLVSNWTFVATLRLSLVFHGGFHLSQSFITTKNLPLPYFTSLK